MMITAKYNSHEGEIAVLKELNKRGFSYQWLSLSVPHEYDILAFKNGKSIKIEVKHTYSDSCKTFRRDSANSSKVYTEKIDFIIVAVLHDFSYIKAKDLWIFPISEDPGKEIVRIPAAKKYLNNYDLLEKALTGV